MEPIVNRVVQGDTIFYYIAEEGYVPIGESFPGCASKIKPISEFGWFRHGGLPCFVSKYSYDFYHVEIQHRVNGPAVVDDSGDISGFNTEDYWCLYDVNIIPTKYFEWLDENGIDINHIGPNELLLIAVKWNTNG